MSHDQRSPSTTEKFGHGEPGSLDVLLKGVDFDELTNVEVILPKDADISRARSEEKAYEVSMHLDNQDKAQDIVLRKAFAENIHKFMIGYFVFVGLVILANSFSISEESQWVCSKFICFQFEMSDRVLMTLLTTTTINVIGLYAIVARYMFPISKPKK